METQQKYNYVKIATNIPEVIQFKFDQPRIYPNRYEQGKMNYSYGVVWRGVDAYLTATEKLHQMLQTLSPLQGKQLQILKKENGNYKEFRILDMYNNDITPQMPQANQVPAQPSVRDGWHSGQPSGYIPPQPAPQNQSNPQIKEWAEKVTRELIENRNKIKDLEKRLLEAEDIVFGLRDGLVYDHPRYFDVIEKDGKSVIEMPANFPAYDLHSATGRQFKEAQDKKNASGGISEQGYVGFSPQEKASDISGIPIVGNDDYIAIDL